MQGAVMCLSGNDWAPAKACMGSPFLDTSEVNMERVLN